jgi:hypothetical protein
MFHNFNEYIQEQSLPGAINPAHKNFPNAFNIRFNRLLSCQTSRKVCHPNIIHVIILIHQPSRKACTASTSIQLHINALRRLIPATPTSPSPPQVHHSIPMHHPHLKPLLFFNGESPALPLIALPTPYVPVQNTQTKTLGNHSSLNPTHPRCNHLLQASHCTIGLPSSSTSPSQTQRVLSFDRVLHSVDGVVVVDGEWLKVFE